MSGFTILALTEGQGDEGAVLLPVETMRKAEEAGQLAIEPQDVRPWIPEGTNPFDKRRIGFHTPDDPAHIDAQEKKRLDEAAAMTMPGARVTIGDMSINVLHDPDTMHKALREAAKAIANLDGPVPTQPVVVANLSQDPATQEELAKYEKAMTEKLGDMKDVFFPELKQPDPTGKNERKGIGFVAPGEKRPTFTEEVSPFKSPRVGFEQPKARASAQPSAADGGTTPEAAILRPSRPTDNLVRPPLRINETETGRRPGFVNQAKGGNGAGGDVVSLAKKSQEGR